MNGENEIEATIEAILFVSPEPVPRQRLFELFAADEQPAVEAALARVIARFAEAEGRGMMVEEVAGGLRIVTRPEIHPALRRYFNSNVSNRLSMAALETLAIVAYRQPITAPEIQAVRGVASGGPLKTLLEKRLIRIAGRKAVVGKPFLYRTTREFLMHFGLADLKDLPPLEEFEEAFTRELPSEPGPWRDGEEEVLRANAELEDKE
jgi:segregation and condensation protein B